MNDDTLRSGWMDGNPRMGRDIGRILEQAREERGISLHQAEQATKIRARYLQELERENFDVLPPVYVQGSLRTYADYLGLDAEALVRELKSRQRPRDEPQGPAHGPGSPAPGAAAPAAAESRSPAEEEGYIAPMLSLVGNYGLYLASAALLVIVLAVVAYASTLAANVQSPVSQLRDPMASQEGDFAYQPRSASDGQNVGGETDSRPPEQRAGQKEKSGDDEDGPDRSEDPAAASTAQPSPATAQSTATPAPSTVAPAGTRPEPAPTGAASPAPEPETRRSGTGVPERRVVTIRRPSSGGPAAARGSSLPGGRMIVVRPRPLAR